MKKVLYIVIALGMVSTFVGALEWMDLSHKTCDRYGKGTCHLGTAYNCGCYGKIKRAEKICRRAGGRLPTMNELKSVALSCGVRPKEFGHGNLENTPFFNCILKKGFVGEKYWSKSREKKNRDYRMIIDFYSANITTAAAFFDTIRIRCVK